eukprot:scaffold1307_cov200-Pinguiococcus_pyrenoidosus.AAC.64
MTSSLQSSSSYSGQGCKARLSSLPRSCQHSSLRCGANGDRSKISASTASRLGLLYSSLTSTIMALMAVFSPSTSTSSVTFLMVLCWMRVAAFGSGPSSPSATRLTRLYTRFWKRTTPANCSVCQGFVASSGPMNISYKRSASAP